MNPEPVFDSRLLALRRQRAARIASHDADFLMVHAARELADRIAVVNRPLQRAVDVLSPSPAIREVLRQTRSDLAFDVAGQIAGNGSLGLEEQAYDLAVSGFGLHWVEDLPGALAQIRRALKPDGLFMAVLPADGTLAELRMAAIAAETALRGGAASRVDPFADIRQAGGLLLRAGFALPVADGEQLTLRYGGVSALIADLRAMGATSAPASRNPRLPSGFGEALGKEYLQRYRDEDGKVRATFNLAYLTGWAPHESQQKPLKPGTALASLHDALRR